MPKGFGKYKTLSEISEEEKGKAPKWLGSGDPHEAERWLLEKDVPKAEQEGLEHDGLAYLAGAGGLKALGPAMGTAGLGKAAGDIKEDPLNPKSYLKAINSVKDFGGFDMNPIASEAMIPTSKNIGKFRERMLEHLKSSNNPNKGEMLEAYLKTRRPVLTSFTGGNVPSINFPKSIDLPTGMARGVSYPIDATDEYIRNYLSKNFNEGKPVKPGMYGEASVAMPNSDFNFPDKFGTASHELLHGTQQKRSNGEAFKDYPRLENYPDKNAWYQDYFKHPTEIQARKAGETGKKDFENFMRDFVPESGDPNMRYVREKHSDNVDDWIYNMGWEADPSAPGGGYMVDSRIPGKKFNSNQEATEYWDTKGETGYAADLKRWLLEGRKNQKNLNNSGSSYKTKAVGVGENFPEPGEGALALDPLNETRYWIHPDGEMQKLGFDEYHDQVSMKQFGHRGQEESLQKGFSRVSNNIGQVGVGASEDALNRTVRLATKSALNDRLPLVHLEIHLPKGKMRELTFQPKDLMEANYDITQVKPLFDHITKAPQGGGF